MAKLPSHSGERPVADAAPSSAETPFDPSHFARHEFPVGLREELIHAAKPRIDPKFLHDTVPPNLPLSDSPPAATVVTSPSDPVVMPAVPKRDMRPLVIGVLAALAALLILGLLIRPSPVAEPAETVVSKTAPTPPESTAAAAAAGGPTPSATPAAIASANSPASAPSALPSEPARAHDKPHQAQPAPKLNESPPSAASEPKPAPPAPNVPGKQPWIDGL